MDLFEKMQKTLKNELKEEATRYVWAILFSYDMNTVDQLVDQGKISLDPETAQVQVGTERIFKVLKHKLPPMLKGKTKDEISDSFMSYYDQSYDMMYTGALVTLDVMELYNPDYENKIKSIKIQ